MKKCMLLVCAVVGALTFTTTAEAGQCEPNPKGSGGFLDCDGPDGEYYCYKSLDPGVWTCRSGLDLVWSTDCPECDGAKPAPEPECDTWVDIFSGERSASACVDDGVTDLAWAIARADLDLREADDFAWCVTDAEGSACYDAEHQSRLPFGLSRDEIANQCKSLPPISIGGIATCKMNCPPFGGCTCMSAGRFWGCFCELTGLGKVEYGSMFGSGPC